MDDLDLATDDVPDGDDPPPADDPEALAFLEASDWPTDG